MNAQAACDSTGAPVWDGMDLRGGLLDITAGYNSMNSIDTPTSWTDTDLKKLMEHRGNVDLLVRHILRDGHAEDAECRFAKIYTTKFIRVGRYEYILRRYNIARRFVK